MRGARWILVATLGLALPAAAAAQVRPTVEARGEWWTGGGGSVGGVAVFLGGSGRSSAPGLVLGWIPAQGGDAGVLTVQAELGPRFALSDAMTLGVDGRAGALRAVATSYDHVPTCVSDVCTYTEPAPAGWSLLLGADVSVELPLSRRVTLAGRFGMSRLLTGEVRGVGVRTLGLGLRYRFR